MNFQLTEEQLMVQEMTRSFAEKEIKPVAPRMDRDSLYPTDLVKRLAKMGLMGIFVPPGVRRRRHGPCFLRYRPRRDLPRLGFVGNDYERE